LSKGRGKVSKKKEGKGQWGQLTIMRRSLGGKKKRAITVVSFSAKNRSVWTEADRGEGGRGEKDDERQKGAAH